MLGQMPEGIFVAVWLFRMMADNVVPLRVIVLNLADRVVPCLISSRWGRTKGRALQVGLDRWIARWIFRHTATCYGHRFVQVPMITEPQRPAKPNRVFNGVIPT